MNIASRFRDHSTWWMLVAFVLCAALYWLGLRGGFVFDDYPNIVDNHNLQIADATVPNLVRAALSSPASEFKRPLASLSFTANYLATGLSPFSWKLTNLVIHLLNGLLVYLLARRLLLLPPAGAWDAPSDASDATCRRAGMVAALVATGWLLLPINLTGVLYVVQRMESLANLFVLLGLLGYVAARERMLSGKRGLFQAIASVTVPTALGLLAKETAVMLPLYALLVEWLMFGFRRPRPIRRMDMRISGLFLVVLAAPMVIGLAWLLPGLLNPANWATRDFTLGTRLLSEARIVSDYVAWVLFPMPDALSFYHDDFVVSSSLLSPWTTLASIAFLASLCGLVWVLRHRRPLISLGVALYLGCHLLTGTILPLELIYEHRNYFASFGLLLAAVPWLAAPREHEAPASNSDARAPAPEVARPLPLSLPRHVLLVGLLVLWATETGLTARAWGNPLRLAQDLALRAPESPRAQYELGRTYIIYSHYDPLSPFIAPAREALERAAALPQSSILPEQALIFMNARMGIPVKDAWWDSMIAKLRTNKPGVQDESSLGALTRCASDHLCALSKQRMMGAFFAALSHPHPGARLLAMYGDYAWNVLDDKALGLRMTEAAVRAAPGEPAYRITQIRMLEASGRSHEASAALQSLKSLNFGGSLDDTLRSLGRRLTSTAATPSDAVP